MSETVSHYWERRGNAIYTEGRFNGSEYIEGSARLIIDFSNQVHNDHVDHIVNSHNNALDMHAAYEVEPMSAFDSWREDWF